MSTLAISLFVRVWRGVNALELGLFILIIGWQDKLNNVGMHLFNLVLGVLWKDVHVTLDDPLILLLRLPVVSRFIFC